MKALKIILIILGILIALFLIVGLLLPSNIKMERKITIDAPATVAYSLLNDLHNFHQWSPFSEMDTTMKVTVSGPTGVGSTYEWNSKGEAGQGKISIIESQPYSLIKCKLDFVGEGTSFAPFTIKEENGKTILTWGFETNLGNSPIKKYFGLFMGPMLGPAYEKGLKSFKILAEKTNKMITDIPITIEQFPGQKLYSVIDSCKMDVNEISEAYSKAFKELGEFCGKNNIVCSGPPLALMITYTNPYTFEAGFPVAENNAKVEKRVIASSIPACKVIKAVYTGPYDKMMYAYDKILSYIKEKKFELRGNAWEQYLNDPGNTAPEKLITNIYFPVK